MGYSPRNMLAFLAALAVALFGIFLWWWWHRKSYRVTGLCIQPPTFAVESEREERPAISYETARLETVQVVTEQDKKVAALEQEVARLERENAELEAKYLAKVKASETRKANLANYRQKHAAARKRLAGEVEHVVAGKDKWVPHGRTQP